MFDDLTACVAARWSPQIGDPTVLGWATVAAYGVTAALLLGGALRAAGRERTLWMLATLLIACLTVNKQLDLQSALTAVGRCVSQMQGWYEDRRSFQAAFIEYLIAGCAAAMVVLVMVFRSVAWRNALLLVGLSAIMAFVAVRAVGFHHFDEFIGRDVGEGFGLLRMNHLLELGALAILMAAGLRRLARRR